LQGPLFEIEPNAVVDFLDAEALAGEYMRDVDAVAVHADATAMGDQDLAVVQRIAALGQVVIANSLRRGVVAAQMVRAEPQPQRILGPLDLSLR